MRLDKYLADMECGTRSELKQEIRRGNAKVNGEIIRDPGFQMTGEEEVIYRGKPVRFEAFSYYMLNKPKGVISASEDPRAKTVIDLLTEKKRKDLFPVGRLDKDTEGLLLITNDGDLAHRLLAPGKHVDKVYEARIAGLVTEEDVQLFRDGLAVSEEFTAMPAELKILDTGTEEGGDAVSLVRITLHEGKYHQIKRMFHAVGKEVLELRRISMGPLMLDPALKPGEYRRLTEEELNGLLLTT